MSVGKYKTTLQSLLKANADLKEQIREMTADQRLAEPKTKKGIPDWILFIIVGIFVGVLIGSQMKAK